jgi:chloramphenicol-sensitive protein RarD
LSTLQDSRQGILLAAAAYIIWGTSPLYWHLLIAVPVVEVTLHRVIWSALALAVVVALQGRLRVVLARLRNIRLLGLLMVTGLLIAFNWGVMIWCVANDEIVQGSFGYFINPLLNTALGVTLLGETLSPYRWGAVMLGIAAVVVQTIGLGEFPLVALALGGSFAVYGYLRKTADIGGLDGVFVEATLLLPLALGVLFFSGLVADTVFASGDLGIDLLLMLCGPVTALPLVLFAAGAKQIRLSTIGLLQYIGPSIGLVLAVFVFGEPFTAVHALTFACVWCALALLAWEGGRRRINPVPVPPQKA